MSAPSQPAAGLGSIYCVTGATPPTVAFRAIPDHVPGLTPVMPPCAVCGPWENSLGAPATCTRCHHVDPASWTARCLRGATR